MFNRLTPLLLSLLLSLPATVCSAADLYFVQSFKIPQNGMYPSLPAHSRFYIKKGPLFKPEKIERGKIVVYEHYKNNEKYYFVWRVIGLPGDSIEIVDDKLKINGASVKRHKLSEDATETIYQESIDTIQYSVAYQKEPDPDNRVVIDTVIPENHYFLVGDNRDRAYDSRFSGAVPLDKIVGIKFP